MRQRSTAPLLAVILAAVLSRGKSFSQSLASHTICLPDTGMRLLLPLPLSPLTAAFLLDSLPLVISSCHPTFSPHTSPLFSPIITSLAPFPSTHPLSAPPPYISQGIHYFTSPLTPIYSLNLFFSHFLLSLSQP